jgi:hypothetical protein
MDYSPGGIPIPIFVNRVPIPISYSEKKRQPILLLFSPKKN